MHPVDTAQLPKILRDCELDLIVKFHTWSLRNAFTQIVAWRKIGVTVPVFLNFSSRYLQDRECITLIKTLLQEYDLPTSCLGIEVTESCEITNMSDVKFVLGQLHDMGIAIALDDFCSSSCSLEHLTELPISIIKIDKRFIQGLVHKSREYQNSVSIVLESIIDMALKLEIEVIAEGVETIQQLEQVTYIGCDAYQGHLYCPPVPARYVSAMLLNVQDQKGYQFAEPLLPAIAL